MSSFPSYGQFRLLKAGVLLGLLAPLIAFSLLFKTGFYLSDYITAVRDTGRLQREGQVTAVPLSGEPRYNDYLKKWACLLTLPDNSTAEYLRAEKPGGVTHLYFYEHPDITGTITRPKFKFEPGEPTRDLIVEVSAHPDWDETFASLARGTFMRKTAWLATLTLLTAGSLWLAWKSYWWMKGGRRRRHRHHH